VAENGARFLGLEAKIGTVAVGNRAGVALIKGDPAAHLSDIENVEIVFEVASVTTVACSSNRCADGLAFAEPRLRPVSALLDFDDGFRLVPTSVRGRLRSFRSALISVSALPILRVDAPHRL
jgi:hypothetical protein